MVGLGELPGGHSLSLAFAASADGSVIVGRSSSALAPNTFGEAFRWTAETGMIGLGVLGDDGFVQSMALAVSADGGVVVGTTSTDLGDEVFRWTEAGGMVALGDLPDEPFPFAFPFGISADGTVIAGTSQMGFHPRCFRWTNETGMVELVMFPGARDCQVWSLSPDGSVAVGEVTVEFRNVAMIWTQAHGMRELTTAMTEAGLAEEIAGWEFERATAVAADNETIVGWGENPEGEGEGFIVNLGPPSLVEIPTLSHGALLAFASLLVVLALRSLGRH
jgi:probable HAF family extracellular repeat protein